jgi:hypothetical protein
MSQQADEDQDYEDFDQFLDSERIAINKVMAALRQHIGQGMEGSAFQREARERFAEIGFIARIDLKKDMNDSREWNEKPWIPDISLVGRCEPVKVGEFDHEKMGHEVRSNIIGKKGQDNVQKTTVGQTGFSATKSGLIVPD